MSYKTEVRGRPNSLDYRLFFRDPKGNVVSPFHDIPLHPAGQPSNICNMVVEVPRWTNAKMEIDTKAKMNPIKQDTKKGKLRFVHNCFPHHGYIWNYGAIPQTWEDPKHTDENTNCKGDNDPIDACEIGFKVHPQGAVIQIKVLGVMALIDEGETDWKVICIDTQDPLADQMNDIDDVETHMPGFLAATYEWFRIYKIPAGKPENQFAFNGEAKNKEFAISVIEQTHKQWQKLLQEGDPELKCENTTVHGSNFVIENSEAEALIAETPAKGDPEPVDEEVNKWHYVKL